MTARLVLYEEDLANSLVYRSYVFKDGTLHVYNYANQNHKWIPLFSFIALRFLIIFYQFVQFTNTYYAEARRNGKKKR